MLDYKILSRSIDNRVFEDSDVVLFAVTVAEACKDGWDPQPNQRLNLRKSLLFAFLLLR